MTKGDTLPVTVVVMAKRPVAGRVKTRLCPPCSAAEASSLATAALRDTLVAVSGSHVTRRVIALDDPRGVAVPPGFRVVRQHGVGLSQRLASVVRRLDGPVLIVGMDTPQVGPSSLDAAARRLLDPGTDAVLGPALDGGYWLLGLRRPRPGVFTGVPMSTPHTCAHQLARLAQLGWQAVILGEERDVDTFDDALAVATSAPTTEFARALATVTCSAGPLGASW